MKSTVVSLYHKLRDIVKGEIEKENPDADLVDEAVDGILRLIPEDTYQITAKQREENIKAIFTAVPKRRFSSRTAKVLLAAAIILALLVVSVVAYTVVEYTIIDNGSLSDVWANFKYRHTIEPIEAGYIPPDFEYFEEYQSSVESSFTYYNKKQDIYLCIAKVASNYIGINTEYVAAHSQIVNGIEYIFYGEEEHGKGVVWFTNRLTYSVGGPLSDEELLKIALEVR